MKPLPAIEIKDHGGLSDELVVDALVVDGRRFFSTIGLVVLHDVGLVDWLDRPGIDHIVVCVPLQWIGVVLIFDPSGIDLRAVPEDEDGGSAVHGTKHGPIGLIGFCELTFYDVMAALDP